MSLAAVSVVVYLLNLREVDSSSKPIKIRIVQAFLDSFMSSSVHNT